MTAAERPHPLDFERSPFVVIWETTKACDLACLHCRAEASPERDARELSTEEGERVLTESAAMGSRIFVLSGGDPLKRPDLEVLIAHGKSVGLRMATIPAATRALTKERISALAAAGLDQIAFSIDGPDPPSHDAFRGIDGSFRRTLLGATYAHEASLPLQINTCFTRWNLEHLEAMVELVCNLGVTFWEVFFLVPMGRGSLLEGLAPEQFDDVFSRLWKLSREADFIVKVTEAPHYRRFVAEHEGSRRNGRKVRPRGARAGIGLSPQAVNSGKGFLFIDHLGNLMPSGFLPLVAGNVRSDSLADVYRHSPLFVDLRRPELLKGRCGRCRYASECGGSRARAYAASTDVFADDPSCCYAV